MKETLSKQERNFLLGRLTALVERNTDMPHRVVPKIAANPVLIARCWLEKATIKDPDELSEVMTKLDKFPETPLPVVQQGDFWLGYHSQCKNSSLRVTIGDQLKAVRIERGMTMGQVAELAGMTESTVSKIENGKWAVSVDLIERLCNALNVSICVTDRSTDIKERADEAIQGEQEETHTERYVFDTHYGKCSLSDRETGMVIEWESGNFNDSSNVRLDGFACPEGKSTEETAATLARIMSEMGDYIAKNYGEYV